MRKYRSLLVVFVVSFCLIAAGRLCSSIYGSPANYEVRPEIRLPQFKTDTARVIDAYERLMDRYMGLIERNLTGIDRNVREVGEKLDSIDGKLARLSARMTVIEKALGIKQPKGPVAPAKTKPAKCGAGSGSQNSK